MPLPTGPGSRRYSPLLFPVACTRLPWQYLSPHVRLAVHYGLQTSINTLNCEGRGKDKQLQTRLKTESSVLSKMWFLALSNGFGCRLGWQYEDLRFPTLQMDSNVFREPGHIVLRQAIPKAMKVTSSNSTRSSSISGGSNSSTQRDPMPSPNRPLYPTDVFVNKDSERLDGKIGEQNAMASESVKRRLKQQNVCFGFHLKGKCMARKCPSSHDRTFSQDEVIALGKIVRRTTPCSFGSGCRSAICMFGHTCPHTPCGKGSSCPFQKFHGKDLRQPRIWAGKFEPRGRKVHESKYEHDLRVLNEEPLVEFEKGQMPIETDRYPVLKPSIVTVTERPMPPKTPAVLVPQKD